MANLVCLAPFPNAVNLDLVREILLVSEAKDGSYCAGLVFIYDEGDETAWLESFDMNDKNEVVYSITETEEWSDNPLPYDNVQEAVEERTRYYIKVLKHLCARNGEDLVGMR